MQMVASAARGVSVVRRCEVSKRILIQSSWGRRWGCREDARWWLVAELVSRGTGPADVRKRTASSLGKQPSLDQSERARHGELPRTTNPSHRPVAWLKLELTLGRTYELRNKRLAMTGWKSPPTKRTTHLPAWAHLAPLRRRRPRFRTNAHRARVWFARLVRRSVHLHASSHTQTQTFR